MSKNVNMQLEKSELTPMQLLKKICMDINRVDKLTEEQDASLETQIEDMVRVRFRGSYADAVIQLSEDTTFGLDHILINGEVFKVKKLDIKTQNDYEMKLKEEGGIIEIDAIINDSDEDFDLKKLIDSAEKISNEMGEESVFSSKKKKKLGYR